MVLHPYIIEYDKGVINRGNWYRIQKVMQKAKKGEEITVGFLGGSITQGCLSSTPETCYAHLVYEWWKNKFPNTKVKYVNAGIGGTTSAFGVARVEKDLLSHEVDFTIVEFSVNDEGTPHFEETYESLIRRIYKHEKQPAILIVNSVFYDTGKNAENIHIPVGKAYGIPCVSMRTTIYDALQNGRFTNRDITQDDLHPNDLGHEMMAEVILHFLEQVYESCDDSLEEVFQMPEPFTKNGYEMAERYQNDRVEEVMSNHGFEKDNTPQNDIREIFRNGWTAWDKDSSIRFKIKGSNFLVQYRKSVVQPTPIAKAIIDGDESHAILLDGNFEETWGDSLHITNLAEHLPYGEHEIEIKITATHEDEKVPFYLVSIIAS